MNNHSGILAILLACAPLIAQAAEPEPQANIELFGYPDFRGAHFSSRENVANLSDHNFNNGAVSLVVHSGQWEVCTDAHYKGRCAVFPTGRYAQLDALTNRISSMRQVR